MDENVKSLKYGPNKLRYINYYNKKKNK